jgi:hypothetical protein
MGPFEVVGSNGLWMLADVIRGTINGPLTIDWVARVACVIEATGTV